MRKQNKLMSFKISREPIPMILTWKMHSFLKEERALIFTFLKDLVFSRSSECVYMSCITDFSAKRAQSLINFKHLSFFPSKLALIFVRKDR
jgi:hypothetical protein